MIVAKFYLLRVAVSLETPLLIMEIQRRHGDGENILLQEPLLSSREEISVVEEGREEHARTA